MNYHNLSKFEMITKILDILADAYPVTGTALNFNSAFELMVAVILSAQCTDKQVNRITARLFKKYNTPQDFAALNQEELAEEIKGCGLHRNKSKHIIEASREILKRHGGQVPRTREELEALPGVGKKTAGVVFGIAFGGHVVPVDTHVYRVARRLGLSGARDPKKVEDDLTNCIQPEQRMRAHHLFIAHGRKVCTARRPACGSCCLKDLCPYPLGGEGS